MLRRFRDFRNARSARKANSARIARRSTEARPIHAPAFEPCEERLLLSSTIQINPQIDYAVTPQGCIADIGWGSNEVISFGWKTATGGMWRSDIIPGGADPKWDQYATFQSGPDCPMSWYMNVPNGEYEVTLYTGDASAAVDIDAINIDGSDIQEDPNVANKFTAVVEVTDGVLSIAKASGEDQARMCYLEITDLDDTFVNLPPYIGSLGDAGQVIMLGDSFTFEPTWADFDSPNVSFAWTMRDMDDFAVVATSDQSTLTYEFDDFSTYFLSLTLTDEAQHSATEVAFGISPNRPVTDAVETGYLIIAADDLVDAVEPLAAWKTLEGYRTEVIALSEILPSQYTFNSTTWRWTEGSDQILKDYIADRYDDTNQVPLEYVLLVGDFEDVPSYTQSESYGPNGIMAVDNWLACVDGDWDFMPNFAIGRLPVSTAQGAEDIVDKIVAYERNPQAGDWYDNALVASYHQDGDDPPDGWADMECIGSALDFASYLQSQRNISLDYALAATNPGEEYTYYTKWGLQAIPSALSDLFQTPQDATDDVINAFESGLGIAIHYAHGNTDRWQQPQFTIEQAAALTNGNMTPVVFNLDCLSGSFDEQIHESLAETFLRNANGGAVGVMAASDVTWEFNDPAILWGVFDALWDYDPNFSLSGSSIYSGLEGSKHIGEAIMAGKYYMYETLNGMMARNHFNSFHWFGDPEMMLRTDTPQEVQVTLYNEGQVVEGIAEDRHWYSGLSAYVQDEQGNPVEGARVCLSQELFYGEMEMFVAISGADGYAHFEYPVFTQAGDYDLVVTGENIDPYEGTVPCGPYGPRVTSELINGGASNRDQLISFEFEFNEHVIVYQNYLTLYWYHDGIQSWVQEPLGLDVDFSYTPNTATWVVSDQTFADHLQYKAVLDSDWVVNVNGEHLDGDGNGIGGDDLVMYFHQLAGDVNGDADQDYQDVLALYNNLGDSLFDLDGDSDADYADVQHLVENIFDRGPADGNLDGVVNEWDHVNWRDNFNQSPANWISWGDFNYDGAVTGADYTTWCGHFDEGTAPAPLTSGGPTLAYTATDLGGGLTSYTFTIDNADALSLSYGLSLAFQGDIQQIAFLGVVDVDTEELATAFNGYGTPPYSMAGDTWVYDGWTSLDGHNPLGGSLNGIDQGEDWYAMSLMSTSTSVGTGISVIHVVVDGDLDWIGSIYRNQLVYELSGSTAA